MKSAEFIQSLNNSDCYIYPPYKFAYETKNYWFVLLLDKVLDILKK